MPIHPTAILAPHVLVREGAFIGPYSVIGFPDTQDTQGITIDHHEYLSTIIDAGVVIHSHCFIAQGVTIDSDCLIESHSYIGSRSHLLQGVELEYGARIYQDVIVGSRTSIGGFVCNKSKIGSGCVIQGKLIHARKVQGNEPSPIVEDNVFVGTDALVIGGITLRSGAYVAAGSVVTRDVSCNTLVKGSPACEAGSAPLWK